MRWQTSRSAIVPSRSSATLTTTVAVGGSGVDGRVRQPCLDAHAVGECIALGRLDRLGVEVDRVDRLEPELRGCDRQDSGPAACVEEVSERNVEQQLEAEPCRRVCACAERATGVDHHRDRVGIGLLPRRADPDRTDPNRPVEGPPAVLPALLDIGRPGAAERRPEPFLPVIVRVRRQLDAVGTVALLEALREELEHDRAGLLGSGRRDRHGDAPQRQRNALFSLSKNPSSSSGR